MATTPEGRAPPSDCPPTPLHAAKFIHPREHQFVPRRSNRLAERDERDHSQQDEPSTPGRSFLSTPPATAHRNEKRQTPRAIHKMKAGESASSSSSMFPMTPAKTPRKAISMFPETPTSITRNIFSSTKTTRISRFTLDEPVSNGAIQIYEDSNARIPEPTTDEEENPFAPSSSRSYRPKRTKTTVEPKDAPTANGMWVTHRGKVSWKDFGSGIESNEPMPRKKLFVQDPPKIDTDDEDTEREDTVEPSPRRNVRFQLVDEVTVVSTPKKIAAKSSIRTPKTEEPAMTKAHEALLTPPTTGRRKRDTTSSFESESASQNSIRAVKRKLDYSGSQDPVAPATPTKTPAKKRGKHEHGNDDFLMASPSRTRRGETKA